MKALDFSQPESGISNMPSIESSAAGLLAVAPTTEHKGTGEGELSLRRFRGRSRTKRDRVQSVARD